MTLAVALVLAGLAVVMVANLVAERSGLPAAVLLVLAGLGYGLLPGPNLRLDPHLVLVVVIPPLLYAAALSSSLLALRDNARAVVSLSVGLVLATAVAVGFAVHAAVPGVPLAVGIAMGAAVSPPDPVAALAIGRRAGLPPRLVTLVEGEGLLNDATALTTLEVAVAAALGGGFSLGNAAGRFAVAAAGGVAAGMVLAVPIGWVRARLDDPLVENTLSLATPFAVYLAAEQVHVSGVLAVVVAGLWLGYRAPAVQSGQSRLQATAVWRLVEYLLEGFVFLLIGQQLPTVVAGLGAYPRRTVVVAAVVTVAVVLVLRPLWLFASARLPARLHSRLGGDPEDGQPALSAGELVALSWSGTRGVITLAAVFSLPLTLTRGGPFPARNLMLFCAFLVVLVTLVGQGLTFAPLLRRLHLESTALDQAIVRNRARLAAAEAALQQLDQVLGAEPQPDAIVGPLRRAAEERRRRYAGRVTELSAVEDNVLPVDGPYQTTARLRRLMIEAARDELLQWRDTGRLPDASLRVLQRELDHEEGLLPRPP